MEEKVVAQLGYSRVTGAIVLIDKQGMPLSVQTARLASGEPLTPSEMREVAGFRPYLEVSSRRVGTDGKLFLALRIFLNKDGDDLDKIEIIGPYRPKFTVVGNSSLTVPARLRSSLGEWSLRVGYAAIYEHELIPTYVKQILGSLPYVFDGANELRFSVAEVSGEILPNGEWSHRVNADGLTNSGRTRPDDI